MIAQLIVVRKLMLRMLVKSIVRTDANKVTQRLVILTEQLNC